MSQRTVSPLTLSATLIFAACSAGATAPPVVSQVQSFQRYAAPARANAIGGIITAKTFVVASGQTTSVTKNLAVFASKSVTIAGTLDVPRGVSVAFFTPKFTIAAPSGNVFATTNRNWNGPVDDIVSACHIEIADSQNIQWYVGAGDNLAFTSSKKRGTNPKDPCTVDVGTSAYFSTSSAVTHGIILAPGVPGGTDPHRYIGQNGGWIVIGSPQAISVTQALAKKDGHAALKAFSPDVVELDSALVAANGGDGRPDDYGTPGVGLNGGYSFTAYAGGIGGSIQIHAGKITGSQPALLAGNGGKGGELAAYFAASSFYDYPLNGTPSAPDALGATLAMGSGGGGGGIFVTAQTPAGISERAGDGGDPSGLGLFIGGSGCCPNGSLSNPSFGTGDGGGVTLDLAAPGKKGPNGNNLPSAPQDGQYALIKFTGGNGSSWLAPLPFYGSCAQGGTGGGLTLIAPPHVPIDKLGDYGLSITIDDFGNGGSSLCNCPATPPGPSGLDGGNAGDLHDNGLFQYVTTASSTSAGLGFNGGGGSNGSPPGNGGKGGKNDDGYPVGSDGPKGLHCFGSSSS